MLKQVKTHLHAHVHIALSLPLHGRVFTSSEAANECGNNCKPIAVNVCGKKWQTTFSAAIVNKYISLETWEHTEVCIIATNVVLCNTVLQC